MLNIPKIRKKHNAGEGLHLVEYCYLIGDTLRFADNLASDHSDVALVGKMYDKVIDYSEEAISRGGNKEYFTKFINQAITQVDSYKKEMRQVIDSAFMVKPEVEKSGIEATLQMSTNDSEISSIISRMHKMAPKPYY